MTCCGVPVVARATIVKSWVWPPSRPMTTMLWQQPTVVAPGAVASCKNPRQGCGSGSGGTGIRNYFKDPELIVSDLDPTSTTK